MTVRDPHQIAERVSAGRPAQPLKVGVVSEVTTGGMGAIDLAGAFLHEGGGRVLVCTSARTSRAAIAALEAEGAAVFVAGADRVDLAASLRAMAELGVARLMVEGGGTLVAALLEAGLVDELQLAVAPLVFGAPPRPRRSLGTAGRARLPSTSTSWRPGPARTMMSSCATEWEKRPSDDRAGRDHRRAGADA